MIRTTSHALGSGSRKTLGAALSLLVVLACTDQTTTPLGLNQPSSSIADGAHGNGGAAHFFFLPPLVPQPTTSGTFDVGLSPVIEIVDLDAMGGPAAIGTLDANLDNSNSHYHQNWHTKDYDLDSAHTYRLRILVDGIQLGYADVDVAANGSELKNIDTGEFIALKDGRTLPIMFRIEEVAPSSGPGWVEVTSTLAQGSLPTDGTVAFKVCDLSDPTICDPDVAGLAIDGTPTLFTVQPGSYSYIAAYVEGADEVSCSITDGSPDDESGTVDVVDGATSSLSFLINCAGF